MGTTSRAQVLYFGYAVHPHACGDNGLSTGLLPGVSGSPPRVWGQRFGLPGIVNSFQVHPHACGDNTREFPSCRSLSWFTPTRVGTTKKLKASTAKLIGSPPRVWGQPWWGRHVRCWSLVHPHACGDNGGRRCSSTTWRGSPPRVWGQQVPCSPWSGTNTVHPHACGDNARLSVGKVLTFLVHPHACGDNAAMASAWDADVRFTPTRVGTTLRPRTHGTTYCGSPPRVWGQRAKP